MAFPKTDKDLVTAGYRFETSTQCRGCKAPIQFWVTPNGKRIPLDSVTLEPHWARCPKAKDFRRKPEPTRLVKPYQKW